MTISECPQCKPVLRLAKIYYFRKRRVASHLITKTCHQRYMQLVCRWIINNSKAFWWFVSCIVDMFNYIFVKIWPQIFRCWLFAKVFTRPGGLHCVHSAPDYFQLLQSVSFVDYLEAFFVRPIGHDGMDSFIRKISCL